MYAIRSYYDITLPALGQQILQQLAQGTTANQAMIAALAEDQFSAYRQVIVIDSQGESACFSGIEALGTNHMVQGVHCVAAGNMLASKSVIDAMVSTFEASNGELTSRLLAALSAGIEQGGEAGPVHSAAVKVVDDFV